MADGQVALPVGVGGVGGGPGLDLLVDRFQLAGGGGQVPGAEQGLDFQVGDQDPGPLGRGDERADLGQVGDGGQRAGQDLRGLLGDVGDVVVAAQGGQVAGDVEQVVVAAAVLLEPAQPHGQGPLVQGGEVACGVAGDQRGGPRVHHDVRARCEQGQVGQPGGVRPQLRQARRAVRGGGPGAGGSGPGLRVKARSSRVIGARQTATWARTAAWLGVSRASSSVSRMSALPRIIAWSTAWATGRSWRRSMSWLAGQVAEPGLDVAQAGAAAAQQRVGELDQPRVPADGPGQQPLVGRVQVGQGGQPQEHPPQLGRRQRRDRHLGQEPVRAGQRVPAGDQQRPGLRPHRPARSGPRRSPGRGTPARRR